MSAAQRSKKYTHLLLFSTFDREIFENQHFFTFDACIQLCAKILLLSNP